ncbi:MAG: hypothetical protein AAF939_04050 [Planctomycetota bacterium]
MKIAPSVFSIVMFCILAVAGPRFGCAQEDLIGEAFQYPPKLMSPKRVGYVLDSIKWQIEEGTAKIKKFRENQENIGDQINNLEMNIKRLQEKMSFRFWMVDSETRSRLAGKLIEVIIDCKLELATIESSSSNLKKKAESSNVSQLAKSESLKAKVKAAELRLEYARTSFERIDRLYGQGSVPGSEKNKASYELKTAELELVAAKNQLELSLQEKDSMYSLRLSELNKEAKTLTARLSAAEKMLDSISANNDIFNSVDSLMSARNRLKSSWEKLEEEALEGSIRITELEVLLNQILQESDLPEDKNKKDSAADSESPTEK